MSAPFSLLVTSEHGGNRIPPAYRKLFIDAGEVLQSHRGWDPGSLELARCIARRFMAPLIESTTSRLLVELNRSLHHPKLFSQYMRSVPPETRRKIIAEYYAPYRDRVRNTIQDLIRGGHPVLHLSIHSFTPVLGDDVRTAEIGLLYDPTRAPETDFCRAWQRQLQEAHPEWRIRRNYPYRGTDDGLTTAMRKQFSPESYLGIEVEITQAWPLGPPAIWKERQQQLVQSLARMLDSRR